MSSRIAANVIRAFSPYASFEALKGLGRGLGLVLAPSGDISPAMYSEISATMQNRQRCGPFDAQFNTRGQAGYYYDTPLGGVGGLNGQVPSDLQLSRIYGYTPVVNSWVPFKDETWTIAPWVPPNGSAGQSYATLGPPLRGASSGGFWRRLKNAAGLRDATATPTQPPMTNEQAAQAAVDALKAHQDRIFALSVVSTAAVATGTVLSVLKHRRESRSHRRGSDNVPQVNPIAGARGRRKKRSR